jgi:hypothetical protein
MRGASVIFIDPKRNPLCGERTATIYQLELFPNRSTRRSESIWSDVRLGSVGKSLITKTIGLQSWSLTRRPFSLSTGCRVGITGGVASRHDRRR